MKQRNLFTKQNKPLSFEIICCTAIANWYRNFKNSNTISHMVLEHHLQHTHQMLNWPPLDHDYSMSFLNIWMPSWCRSFRLWMALTAVKFEQCWYPRNLYPLDLVFPLGVTQKWSKDSSTFCLTERILNQDYNRKFSEPALSPDMRKVCSIVLVFTLFRLVWFPLWKEE